jgi:hypothetical protein
MSLVALFAPSLASSAFLWLLLSMVALCVGVAISTILGGAAAAGSLIRAGTSLFGDSDSSGSNRGDRLSGLIEKRFENIKGQSATDSPLFQAGKAALTDQVRDQAERAEARLAARGLGGSQLEVALSGERADALTKGVRKLVTESERLRQRREEGALSRLLQAESLGADIDQRRRRADERRRRRVSSSLKAALQGATMAIGGGSA